jgi:histone deacetylase HOS2
VRAHGACVAFTKTFGLPLLVVGGGGYTPRNVSRAWAHETSILLEADKILDPTIPDSVAFRNHFGPDYSLFPPLSELRKLENKNPRPYLAGLVEAVHEQLRYIQGAPSVQMSFIPPDILGLREDTEKEIEEQMLLAEEEREEFDGGGSVAAASAAVAGSGAAYTGSAGAIPRPNRRRELERGAGYKGELYS